MSHNFDAYSYLPVDGTSIRDLRSTVLITGTARWSKEYLEQRRAEWEALGWTPHEHGTFHCMSDSLRITVQYPTSLYQVKNAVLASLFGTTSEIVKAITWGQEVKEQLEHAMTAWLPEHHNLRTYLSLTPRRARFNLFTQHLVRSFRSVYAVSSPDVEMDTDLNSVILGRVDLPTRKRMVAALTSDQVLKMHMDQCLENTERLGVILDQLDEDMR